MQVGRTTQEIAKEIIRQNTEKYDVVANGKSLRLLHEGSPEYQDRTGAGVLEAILDGTPDTRRPTEYVLDTGAEGTLLINDWCHGQLASKVGIPKVYYDRLRAGAPDLLLRNVNHWFSTELEDKDYFIRTLDGTARAFLSSRFRAIDNVDIANVVFELVKNHGLDVKASQITDTQLHISALSPRLKGEVKVGDVVQAGITVRNSEVGAGSFKVQKFFWRAWCSNGCSTQKLVAQTHLGSSIEVGDESRHVVKSETQQLKDAALFSETADVVNHALSDEAFSGDLDKLREAAGTPITGKVEKVCERVAKKIELNKPEASSLLNNLAADGDLSKWGLLNAVTKIAHESESYDRNTELQAAGGKVLEFTKPEWQALNAG